MPNSKRYQEVFPIRIEPAPESDSVMYEHYLRMPEDNAENRAVYMRHAENEARKKLGSDVVLVETRIIDAGVLEDAEGQKSFPLLFFRLNALLLVYEVPDA